MNVHVARCLFYTRSVKKVVRGERKLGDVCGCEWRSVVWNGVEWSGVQRCGVVWCGVVSYGNPNLAVGSFEGFTPTVN